MPGARILFHGYLQHSEGFGSLTALRLHYSIVSWYYVKFLGLPQPLQMPLKRYQSSTMNAISKERLVHAYPLLSLHENMSCSVFTQVWHFL